MAPKYLSSSILKETEENENGGHIIRFRCISLYHESMKYDDKLYEKYHYVVFDLLSLIVGKGGCYAESHPDQLLYEFYIKADHNNKHVSFDAGFYIELPGNLVKDGTLQEIFNMFSKNIAEKHSNYGCKEFLIQVDNTEKSEYTDLRMQLLRDLGFTATFANMNKTKISAKIDNPILIKNHIMPHHTVKLSTVQALKELSVLSAEQFDVNDKMFTQLRFQKKEARGNENLSHGLKLLCSGLFLALIFSWAAILI